MDGHARLGANGPECDAGYTVDTHACMFSTMHLAMHAAHAPAHEWPMPSTLIRVRVRTGQILPQT